MIRFGINAADLINKLPEDYTPMPKGTWLKDENMTELRTAVVTELMGMHGFTIDEAEEAVAKSTIQDEEIWHEEANAVDVAKFIASDENEE